MRTLRFEGAGWEKADHNGVGNCRIRATFLNKNGVEVYLELIGHAPHKWSTESTKKFNFAGFVSHAFKSGNHDSPLSIQSIQFEYTKERILGLVNSAEVGGEFDSIEVLNSGWDGFKVDGGAQ